MKRSEESLKKILEKKTFADDSLDYSLLSSAVTDRNVELISQEGYRLLESFYSSFQREKPEVANLKDAIIAYYFLNDAILAYEVGDTNIEGEINQLKTYLASAPSSMSIKISEVVGPLMKIIKEERREPYAEEARTAFKTQLSTIKWQ
jgi:hypothetical protein